MPDAKDMQNKFLVMKERWSSATSLSKKTDTNEIDNMNDEETKTKMTTLTEQIRFNLAMLDHCEQKANTKKTKSKISTRYNIDFTYKGQNYKLEIKMEWSATQLRRKAKCSVLLTRAFPISSAQRSVSS